VSGKGIGRESVGKGRRRKWGRRGEGEFEWETETGGGRVRGTWRGERDGD